MDMELALGEPDSSSNPATNPRQKGWQDGR